MDKKTRNILLLAGGLYLAKKGYDYYIVSTNVEFRFTGVRLKQDPQGLYEIQMFIEIANLTNSTINVSKISGTIYTSQGYLLTYYQGGATVLKPGVNKYEVSAKLDNVSVVQQIVASILSGKSPKRLHIKNNLFLGFVPVQFKMDVELKS